MIVPRYRGLGADPSQVTAISDAIARMENTNPSYNNPGGLVAGPGSTGTAPNGIAIFPDASTGRAALERQVGIDIDRGWSLNQLINSWAPTGCGVMCQGNNPTAYANNVATWTGLPQDVPLNTLNTDASAAVDAAGVTFDTSAVGDSSGWMWAGVIGLAILAAMALD